MFAEIRHRSVRAWVFASCVLSFVWTVSSASGQATREKELSFRPGEQTTLSAEGIKSYSVGSPDILDVRVTQDGRHFILVARRVGTTSLLFIHDDDTITRYDITVSREEGEQVEDDQRPQPARERKGKVEKRPNIRLDLYFLELAEDSHLKLGVNFPGSIGVDTSLNATVGLAPSTFTTANLSITSQVLPRLDLLHQNGWARLMRHAVVVTANGTSASFSSGGEVNFSVKGGLGGRVGTIRFGSKLKFSPRYDEETGRIRLKITADVSDLTDSPGDLPGRSVTNMNSVVNVELGQSIVLGGIHAESEAQSRGGLPGLSQIPIIGILFGSHEWKTRRSENVLLIVPSVVDPVSRDKKRLISEALRIYRDYDGDLEEEGLGNIVEPPTSALPPPQEPPEQMSEEEAEAASDGD